MIFNITGFVAFLVLGLIGVGSYVYDFYKIMSMPEHEFKQKPKTTAGGINKKIIQSNVSLVLAAWFADRLFM